MEWLCQSAMQELNWTADDNFGMDDVAMENKKKTVSCLIAFLKDFICETNNIKHDFYLFLFTLSLVSQETEIQKQVGLI